MRVSRGVVAGLTATLGLAAPAAQAHMLGMHGAGFAAGVAHPFLGLDHLLAMVAVGLWAAQLGGKALWRVPLSFMTMLAAGALLALAGATLPAVETWIASSVLVLGLLLATSARWPVAAGMALVGVFAVFHGYSHGLEMPQAAHPLAYAGGFLLATASLHAVGILAGRLISTQRLWIARAAGVVLAGSGVWLLMT